MELTKENKQQLFEMLSTALRQKEQMHEAHGRIVWGDPQDDVHEAISDYENSVTDYVSTLERLIHKLISIVILEED